MEVKHGNDEMSNRIALDILIHNKVYEFKNYAKDDEVKQHGLIAWNAYSGRETLVDFVNRYGYTAVNDFVKMLGDELDKLVESD